MDFDQLKDNQDFIKFLKYIILKKDYKRKLSENVLKKEWDCFPEYFQKNLLDLFEKINRKAIDFTPINTVNANQKDKKFVGKINAGLDFIKFSRKNAENTFFYSKNNQKFPEKITEKDSLLIDANLFIKNILLELDPSMKCYDDECLAYKHLGKSQYCRINGTRLVEVENFYKNWIINRLVYYDEILTMADCEFIGRSIVESLSFENFFSLFKKFEQFRREDKIKAMNNTI